MPRERSRSTSSNAREPSVRQERSPRLPAGDRDRPVAKAVATFRRADSQISYSKYLSPRPRSASAIEKSPLLPGRSSGSQEKALTNQGRYEERATGVEPATSSLGSCPTANLKARLGGHFVGGSRSYARSECDRDGSRSTEWDAEVAPGAAPDRPPRSSDSPETLGALPVPLVEGRNDRRLPGAADPGH